MGEIGRSFVRIGSFTGKELREVLRRPGVLASLILGPFLIMFLFGIGYTGYRAPFATEVVIPEGTGLPREREYYADLAPGRLDVREIGSDAEAAERRLAAGEIDLLIVAPENASAELRAGRQTTIRVAWNEVDPVYHQLAVLATSILVSSINAEIIEIAASEGLAFVEGEVEEVTDVPPEVIANPTTAETENIAPSEPGVINFFGPAVFALVLQHLAITLTALSMVRERLSGQFDRFRVAPVSSMELLTGKYVAYAALSLGVAAIVGALLVGILGVPLLGGWTQFIGVVLLLAFASLGVGLLISLVADSERQAVQLSMLVLLASVFFSGFILPLIDFAPWARYLAYALPVTHGIALLQDQMLRGDIGQPWMIAALAAIGVLLFVGTLMRLQRVLHRAD